MAENVFFGILHQVGRSCSGFGHYFANVQSSNCHDCPNCRCEDGPSMEEARRDYHAMHRLPLPYL